MRKVTLTVGRQRSSRSMSPFESGYLGNIRSQMKSLQIQLKAIIEDVKDVTPEAMVVGLQPAFDESQKLVPVDKGVLKQSGFLKAARTNTGASVALGYGFGGNPVYAAHVHERLDIPHKSPTQAKFLESAVNMHIDKFLPRVVKHIQRTTGLTP